MIASCRLVLPNASSVASARRPAVAIGRERRQDLDAAADADEHGAVGRPQREQELLGGAAHGGQALAGHAEAAIERHRDRQAHFAGREHRHLLTLPLLEDLEGLGCAVPSPVRLAGLSPWRRPPPG